MVGIPEPDEHFGVNLQLSLDDQAAMEVELALFVHYLPAIGNLLASHRNAGVRAISGYFLELHSDANLLVWWFDSQSLRRHEAKLKLI